MMETNNRDVIDVGKILKLLWSKRKLFFIVWIVTFALSCLWILPKPRYYSAAVTLAPEKTDAEMSGGLSSIASSFGLSVGSSSDAIYPLLYPDLVASNDFIISLFDIPVKSIDGEIDCDFYTYMDKYQKVAFYEIPFLRMAKWFRETFGEKEPDMHGASTGGKVNGINPSFMSRRQETIVFITKKCIGCGVDKKTELITIGVKAQDPLICTTLADSVAARLQRFITDYRTSKARLDLDHYTALAAEARAKYDEARHAYERYADTYSYITVPSYRSQRDDLENEMQLRYNTYTSMMAQKEMMIAKVQERTPAFTAIQSATVPHKASEPKRMLFCIAMLFLATCGTIVWVLFKNRDASAPEKADNGGGEEE